jgi:glycosyltransferase involved in cell wall biosynthesis
MEVCTTPKVSVIVPVYSLADTFVTCLAHLLQAVSTPHEIIIVADGPAPELTHLARQCGVQVVQLTEASGPAAARNRGAAAAQGDILFFVDSDVAIPTDIIPRLVAEFEQAPQLAAVIGSYNDRPAAPNFLSQYRNLLHHYTHQNSDDMVTTFWAGCGAIWRHIFLAAGGFDETFRQPSVEDIELGYRLTAAGHQIRLHKSLQVTHLKRWQAATIVRTDFWQRALPWTRLLLQRQRLDDNNLNIDITNRTSVALFYALILMVGLGFIWPPILLVGVLVGLLLLAVNRHFYYFFWQRRGLVFTLGVIPWHWLYYWYSGLAFILGNFQYFYLLLHQRLSPFFLPAPKPAANKLFPIGDKRIP